MASSEPAASAPAGAVYENEDARRRAELARTDRARKKQTLELQRENILSQRTSNPGRRQALETALTQIEAQIAELG